MNERNKRSESRERREDIQWISSVECCHCGRVFLAVRPPHTPQLNCPFCAQRAKDPFAVKPHDALAFTVMHRHGAMPVQGEEAFPAFFDGEGRHAREGRRPRLTDEAQA